MGWVGASSNEVVDDGNMEIEMDFDATSAALQALYCTVGTRAVLEGDTLDHQLTYVSVSFWAVTEQMRKQS